MIKFEWDSKKALLNRRKHGISFDEAVSVFFDEDAVQFYDEGNSSSEDRFILLGMSSALRILVVVHCERECGSALRIISARKATKQELLFYTGGKA